MPLRDPNHILDIAPDIERALDETSDEPFDRAAFAMHALDLVRIPGMTVAVCLGAARLRVDTGRAWGRTSGAGVQARGQERGQERGHERVHKRWAVLAIPANASRRAIALAVAGLSCGPATPAPGAASVPPAPPAPYVLDVLLS
jgi:hypothetical protein